MVTDIHATASGDDKPSRETALVLLYVLADFLSDISVENKAVRALVQGLNAKCVSIPWSFIKVSFDQTPEGCGLQLFLANRLSRDMKTPLLSELFVLTKCF